jgi:hypothetical protein
MIRAAIKAHILTRFGPARGPWIAYVRAGVRAGVSAGLCVLLSFSTAADIYRWVDDTGVVNYSQQKPRGQAVSLIRAGDGARPSTATPIAANDEPTVITDPNLSTNQQSMLNELQAAEQQRRVAVEKIRTSNCATSKRVLQKLQVNGRIRIRDAAGEEITMTDEDRDERIRQAHQSIAVNCDSLS